MPDDVKRNIDTEGGAAVEGSVNAGGDFVGRDQETHVSAEGHSIAVGRDVHGDIYVYHGAPPSPGSPYQRPANVEEALDRYREDVQRRFGTIQIFGQPEPVPLEGIFTHVCLLDEPTAFQRYDVRALQQAIAEEPDALRSILHSSTRKDVQVVEGTKLVTRSEAHRLLVLGKPGAGKTTFLQHLALEAAKGTLQKLPIFVALREWREIGDQESLLDFIARQFDICQFPNARSVVDYFLRHSDTLVLFDGLDEIPEEDDHRGQAIDTLRDFARKYPHAQILITCRVAATDYTFRGFKYVELADFNEEQMHAFVKKWFRNEKELAAQFWEEYQRPENWDLRELGHIPLLLALLCLGYAEMLSFPHRRVALYEETLDALLKKWDASRRIRREEIYRKLSLDRKNRMFSQLAT
jgi:predicted NACHT family NTPase